MAKHQKNCIWIQHSHRLSVRTIINNTHSVVHFKCLPTALFRNQNARICMAAVASAFHSTPFRSVLLYALHSSQCHNVKIICPGCVHKGIAWNSPEPLRGYLRSGLYSRRISVTKMKRRTWNKPDREKRKKCTISHILMPEWKECENEIRHRKSIKYTWEMYTPVDNRW